MQAAFSGTGARRLSRWCGRAGGMSSLLSIKDLTVRYGESPVAAVEGLSLDVEVGQRVGIVGESGSGKTTLATAVTRLLPGSARIESGSVQFDGLDLLRLGGSDLRKVRGSRIGRVPQDPLAALTPVITIGHQLRDVVRAHRQLEGAEERAAIVGILTALGMPDIEVKLRSYPYELSGGMRQRVLIAMALVNAPELVVADEPTTALDSTVQVQILELLRRAGDTTNMSLMLISHDIHVVSSICERLVVMYGGQIVEDGPTGEVLGKPLHPYTKLLARASTSSPGSAFYATKAPRFTGAPPQGACKYLARCPEALKVCIASPQLEELDGRRVRCFAASGGQSDQPDDEVAPAGPPEEEPVR